MYAKYGGKDTHWVLHLTFGTVGDTVTAGDKVKGYFLLYFPHYFQGLEWSHHSQKGIIAVGCPPVCFE